MKDKRVFDVLVNGMLYKRAIGTVLADMYFSRAMLNFPPWVRIQIKELNNKSKQANR